MIKIITTLLLASLSFSVFSGIDEDSVLADWEVAQRSYPQTTTFEKTEEEKIYLFENHGFSYSGKITVKNVIIEKGEGSYGTTADVVVDLDIDDEELYEKHGYSYGRWSRSNHLVYDSKKERWVRFKDLSKSKKKCSSRKKTQALWRQLLVATFPILLIIAIFMFFIRNMNKGGNIHERLLDSNLDIAKELKRIADQLEKK